MAETKKQKLNKVEKFSLSITRNLGNFESMKVEAEWTPFETDTDAESVCRMQRQLEAAITAAIADRTKKKLQALNCEAAFNFEHKKEGEQYPQMVTTKDEELLQRIVNRLDAGTPPETVFKYYTFNENALKVISIAVIMGTNNLNPSGENK